MGAPAVENRLDVFTPTVGLKRETEAVVTSYQLAGAGARALAGTIDLALQAVMFGVIARACVMLQPDLFPAESWPWAIPVGFVEWHIIYLMLAESLFRGRTPGMTAIGLRVISTAGSVPRPLQTVTRAVGRIVDVALGAYAVSFFLICRGLARQSVADHLAGTFVIYATPLRSQMAAADVPESLYSTSEAGYLLQAWIDRNKRMDDDSKAASALDLSAYLHSVYDPEARELPEPATYLRGLFERELAVHENASDGVHPATTAKIE